MIDDGPEFTRWRPLENPISPMDPIDCASLFNAGHLPAKFVLLLWDGGALRGPMKFPNQAEADAYCRMQPGVRAFLVIPKPSA